MAKNSKGVPGSRYPGGNAPAKPVSGGTTVAKTVKPVRKPATWR